MSTILFHASNRLSLWHGGEAQPLLVLLCESDERSQTIAPAVSERDRGWFGWLEHHGRQFFRIYTRAIRQPTLVKNIAASQNARGSGHLCLLSRWGSAVWREIEKRGRKNRKGSKEGEKRTRTEMAVWEQTKPASATVLCSLKVMCYLHHCSE